MTETESGLPPTRSPINTRSILSVVTSVTFLLTAVLVMIGLTYVTITTHVLWIQALLVILIIFWFLMVTQTVRLAFVNLIGLLIRLGLLPTDYQLSPDTIEDNPLPTTALQLDTISADELTPTTMPQMPSLSVLIPAVNEDEELISRGIRSVRTTRYNGLLRIYVLDDSKDGKYKALAQENGVEYVARPVKTHGKAGNLNYAMKNYVDTELFFVMDCDYEIIDPEIFTKMVGLMDERTALVQAPQRYLNVADSKASKFAEIENVMWFDTINAHADRYSIVPYHGTNSIVRTEALREVGYNFEDGAVDDFPTYARMLQRGWKTAYLPDVVMEGSGPKDLQGLMKQRKKWAMGMGTAFVKEGYKLLRTKNFVAFITHWCNFTWFSWPLTNLAYSIMLGIFIILEYLHIFKIPLIPILVLLHLAASLLLLPVMGGRKFGLAYLQMLSVDYLLTFEFGWNYIKGVVGLRTDVLTPKTKTGLSTGQLLKLVLPIIVTICFFLIITVLAVEITEPFYACFGAYNAIMYAYSLTNLETKTSKPTGMAATG